MPKDRDETELSPESEGEPARTGRKNGTERDGYADVWKTAAKRRKGGTDVTGMAGLLEQKDMADRNKD